MSEKEDSNSEQVSRTTVKHNSHILFGSEVTFSKLASLVAQEAKIKQTGISESFTFEDYQNEYGKRTLPLFAIDNKERLHFFTASNDITPENGWTIVALIQTEKNETPA